jgi:hypothetical protein
MLSEREQAALDNIKAILADGKPGAIFSDASAKNIDLAKWSHLPLVPNKDTWYQDFRNVMGVHFVLWRELETRVQNMWVKWEEAMQAIVAMAETFASEPEEGETTEEKFEAKVEAFASEVPESSVSHLAPGSFDPWGIG